MTSSSAPHSLRASGKEQIVSPRQLADWVRDSRERTFDLVADLSDEQLMGPRLAIVNPMLWEIDRKSTRLNSSHIQKSRMPSSA